jgi:hypothetical protein
VISAAAAVAQRHDSWRVVPHAPAFAGAILTRRIRLSRDDFAAAVRSERP